MGYDPIDNFDHDPDLATALGNMLVAWAYVESVLRQTFTKITGMEDNMALLAYYLIPTFDSRVKLIRSVTPEWDVYDSKKEKVIAAVDHIRTLSKQRNSWVHGVWVQDIKKTHTAMLDYRSPSESQTRRRKVKSKDVVDHVTQVRKRANYLLDLVPPPARYEP